VEVWGYCEESVRYLFGDATGDETADMILKSLAGATEGMSTTQISAIFGRHKSATQIQRALTLLEDRELVFSMKAQTGGAPVTIWQVAKKAN